MKKLVLPLLLVASVAAAQEMVEKKAPTIHKAETAGATVYYLNIPWGPVTFGAMEKGADSANVRRTWAFARIETSKPATLGAAKLAPGNYALVFHPNQGKGMALEVLKIAAGEFLEAGNPRVATPAGESVHKEPITFETAESVAALALSIDTQKDGQQLVIRYGDRKLARALKL
jgi:hypothetical protein